MPHRKKKDLLKDNQSLRDEIMAMGKEYLRLNRTLESITAKLQSAEWSVAYLSEEKGKIERELAARLSAEELLAFQKPAGATTH